MKALRTCLLLALAGLGTWARAGEAMSADQAFESMKARAQVYLPEMPEMRFGIFGAGYVDMHGNPNPPLQVLLRGRSTLTSAITKEIEQTDPDLLPVYLEMLYRVLAQVADPGSIPWLEARLAGPRRTEVTLYWLPAFPKSRWALIDGAERWAGFLRRWASGGQAGAPAEALRRRAAMADEPATMERDRALAAWEREYVSPGRY